MVSTVLEHGDEDGGGDSHSPGDEGGNAAILSWSESWIGLLWSALPELRGTFLKTCSTTLV